MGTLGVAPNGWPWPSSLPVSSMPVSCYFLCPGNCLYSEQSGINMHRRGGVQCFGEGCGGEQSGFTHVSFLCTVRVWFAVWVFTINFAVWSTQCVVCSCQYYLLSSIV